MIRIHSFLSSAALVALSSLASAQAPVVSVEPVAPIPLDDTFTIVIEGTPGDRVYAYLGDQLGTFPSIFGDLAFNPFGIAIYGLGVIPASGEIRFECGPVSCQLIITQGIYFVQALVFKPGRGFPLRAVTNAAPMDFVTNGGCPPCVSEAPVDTNVWECSQQVPTAFYMPGCDNKRFDWATPGTFVELADGTARLTGTIKQVDDSDNQFCVDMVFSQRSSLAQNDGIFPPAMSPKTSCVADSALAENGGPIDTSEWKYYGAINGTLVGKDDLDGTNFDVVLRGPAAQMGYGGALKNTLYGLSAWLTFTRTSGSGCTSTIEGDINVNLKDICN